jgi:hypothetical protein
MQLEIRPFFDGERHVRHVRAKAIQYTASSGPPRGTHDQAIDGDDIDPGATLTRRGPLDVVAMSA